MPRTSHLPKRIHLQFARDAALSAGQKNLLRFLAFRGESLTCETLQIFENLCDQIKNLQDLPTKLAD